jgi:hypothetical protein
MRGLGLGVYLGGINYHCLESMIYDLRFKV